MTVHAPYARRYALKITALAAAILLSACSAEEPPYTSIDCPFDASTHSDTHSASCSRFERVDEQTQIAFDFAVLSPIKPSDDSAILYIPGGPGDAPVSENGIPPDFMSDFPTRTIIAFNPRGTAGTTPRIDCDFGDVIWEEDFEGTIALQSVRSCRKSIPLNGQRDVFSSRAIADDIALMIEALEIPKAGITAVSYGTEAALYLAAENPPWLDFTILDSVSIPGLSDVRDELVARDRFLSTLEDTCFAQKKCSADVRAVANTLSDVTALYDAQPLNFTLGPSNAEWSMDNVDMTDYLAGLSSFPAALEYAVSMIDLMVVDRAAALEWMEYDLKDNILFSKDNLPLILQAYSDTFTPQDREDAKRATRYPTDRQGRETLLDFYEIWSDGIPQEPNFTQTIGQSDARILVLSGGLDTATPAEWGNVLNTRFSNITRYIFPQLGHAVSYGDPDSAALDEVATELRCADAAIPAFIHNSAPPERCALYRPGDSP